MLRSNKLRLDQREIRHQNDKKNNESQISVYMNFTGNSSDVED